MTNSLVTANKIQLLACLLLGEKQTLAVRLKTPKNGRWYCLFLKSEEINCFKYIFISNNIIGLHAAFLAKISCCNLRRIVADFHLY